jgi:hypothetical protein
MGEHRQDNNKTGTSTWVGRDESSIHAFSKRQYITVCHIRKTQHRNVISHNKHINISSRGDTLWAARVRHFLLLITHHSMTDNEIRGATMRQV